MLWLQSRHRQLLYLAGARLTVLPDAKQTNRVSETIAFGLRIAHFDDQARNTIDPLLIPIAFPVADSRPPPSPHSTCGRSQIAPDQVHLTRGEGHRLSDVDQGSVGPIEPQQ
jgi:hypothetical protein